MPDQPRPSWWVRFGGWIVLGVLALVGVIIAVAVALSRKDGKSYAEVIETKATLAVTREQVRAELAGNDDHVAELRADLADLRAIEDDRARIEGMIAFERRLNQ